MSTQAHRCGTRPSGLLVIFLAMQLGASAFAADDAPVSYNRDIRPILANSCFRCHGPDANARKGDFRLDVREEAIAKAIVPGDSFSSKLLDRVTDADPEHRMPPPEKGEALSEAQVALLAQWIDAGADYERHWAYVEPVRPALPAVEDGAWPINAIDRFVLARLDAEGIAPSPEADAITLIRRLHFDLIGLPPTPGDLAAFRETTYDEYVDRLLASEHYGERMAIGWLDLVRYADSTGYHGDEFWDMFPYRDYVIDAFNRNTPFDEFTIEQIGGDLLPGDEQQNTIASAYNRLNQVTTEGGANVNEYLVKYASDRARTTATTWLGATIGCAECHDHKYDPISMRDFYSFTAFFADVEDPGVYKPGADYAPFLELPTDEEAARMDALNKEIAAIKARIQAAPAQLVAEQAAWEKELRDDIAKRDKDWEPVTLVSARAEDMTKVSISASNTVVAGGPTPPYDAYTVTFRAKTPRITGLRIEALDHASYRRSGKISSGSPSYCISELELKVNGESVSVARAVADSETNNGGAALAIDGDAKTGWTPQVLLVPGNHQLVAAFERPVAATADTEFELTLRFEAFPLKQVEHFSVTVTGVGEPALGPRDGISGEIVDAVLKGAKGRTAQQSTQVGAYYASISPKTRDDRVRLLDAMEELRNVQAGTIKLPITVSQAPRTVNILKRGNWMDPTDETVAPGTLSCLPAAESDAERLGRLDLARWIVSDSNPLTARVFVNRLWEQYFGHGLSRVLDDFGIQGAAPTHPELLDWMAVEFMESGWDVKHMVRMLVTSRTYRQGSAPRPDLADVDPNNRLYARQYRSRLDAELVRDNALSVSGLLNAKVGGPSAFPYQPEGYYDHTNTQFSGQLTYPTDLDEDQYRRGLYTVWKRSFLHPSMQAFDAPAREECTAERTQSNTPLQALVLLNDPTYIEAARAFAERMVREGGASAEAKVGWAFEQVLLRPARDAEVAVMTRLYAKHLAEYEGDPERARALLSIGIRETRSAEALPELAAWTSVARTLLNLHETITRS